MKEVCIYIHNVKLTYLLNKYFQKFQYEEIQIKFCFMITNLFSPK